MTISNTDLLTAMGWSNPNSTTSSASNFPTSQCVSGDHMPNAGGDHNLQGAKLRSNSIHRSPPAPTSPVGHEPLDDQHFGAGGGSETSEGHRTCGHQRRAALGSKPATGQRLPENQFDGAGSDQTTTTGQGAFESQNADARGGWLRDPVLGILADVLDDYENVRIANENRVRQLTRSEEDADGVERGFGLTLDHPNVARLQASVVALADAEADAVKNLQKAMKTHPLGPWVKAQPGIGEKQAARLIASIGDPYWNDLHERPRTVSELWAYCGYAVNNGHAQARRRGEQANWSTEAKKRAWLIAGSCIKQPATRSKYRRIYDDARAKYADAEHPHECKRCGPAGKPAQPGSPLSAGHQHARAMRLMSKEILKDLWIESKRLYEEGTS